MQSVNKQLRNDELCAARYACLQLVYSVSNNPLEDAVMIIRLAMETDIPALLALYAQLEQDKETAVSLQEAMKIFRRMESYPNYHIYIAEQQGEALGTFSLAIMDNLAHCGAKSGLIEDVVVDEKHRGLGIGKKMMQYAMNLCKKNFCYKVCLSSNLKRESAHGFYESLGFQKHGYSFQIRLDFE